eukprot:g1177.t1
MILDDASVVTFLQPAEQKGSYKTRTFAAPVGQLLQGCGKQGRGEGGCWNLDDFASPEDGSKPLKWGWGSYFGRVSLPAGVRISLYTGWDSTGTPREVVDGPHLLPLAAYEFWNGGSKRICSVKLEVSPGGWVLTPHESLVGEKGRAILEMALAMDEQRQKDEDQQAAAALAARLASARLGRDVSCPHPGVVAMQCYTINGEKAPDSTGWALFARPEWTCCGDPDKASTYCLPPDQREALKPSPDEAKRLTALAGEAAVAATRCRKGHDLEYRHVTELIFTPNCNLCMRDIKGGQMRLRCDKCNYDVCRECFDRMKREGGEGKDGGGGCSVQ